MPSIRHHLTLAEASLVAARGHLESALDHTIDQDYNTKWPTAIDDVLTKIAHAATETYNINTCIELPATTATVPPDLFKTPTGA